MLYTSRSSVVVTEGTGSSRSATTSTVTVSPPLDASVNAGYDASPAVMFTAEPAALSPGARYDSVASVDGNAPETYVRRARGFVVRPADGVVSEETAVMTTPVMLVGWSMPSDMVSTETGERISAAVSGTPAPRAVTTAGTKMRSRASTVRSLDVAASAR